MKLKIAFLVATGLLLASAVHAQCGTRNAQAFLQVRFPGTIPVDDNRQPLRHGADSGYTVYLESAARHVDGGLAWIGNKAYAVNALAVETLPYAPGREKASGEELVMGQGLRHPWRAWLLELKPLSVKKKAPAKTGAGKMILQLTIGGKKCTQTIGRITELSVPPSV